MKIENYLDQIEFAATETLKLIWRDYDSLEKLKARRNELQSAVIAGYSQAHAAWSNAETPDDVMLGVGRYWDTYDDSDREHHKIRTEIEAISEQIEAKKFSIDALSGTLLQYAKQGLSFAGIKFEKNKMGKLIGSQPLAKVILDARNQSMHWDEGPRDRPTFDRLSEDIDSVFSQYSSRNLAFEIIKLLQWTSFESFKKDLMSFS